MGSLLKSRRGFEDFDINDLGTPDTLRYNVLTLIINEEYDRSINHLHEFINSESEYPHFRNKVAKYIKHSVELVKAIQNKREYPGMSLLTKSRQVELKEKAREHFQDLKNVLRKVEVCQEEMRLTDIKSTTMVVKTIWFCVLGVCVYIFLKEVLTGMGHTFLVVFDQYLGEWISGLFLS